ncbi:hypothetical protein PAAG_00084 [Paracoccidioides lutzii Pb01]|uniref:Uncharacterized protein n=1 Tax=Paracoccidioides lutzii (strain ATCC MYA-826 / Pb01) TaxID=502779 RepID=C1GNI9_PARBA|nr:hypothetical protein PAAG_00084 [Paracoccidioides lutzii Pb01]EEH35761.2 hypothetical protein PAAG_00084 [Paracoccidioides lutzii Pb01]
MSSPIATLAFGVEIELLLKPKEDRLSDKNRITPYSNVILALLCSVSVETKLNTGTYENWTVADEPALDERPGFFMSSAAYPVIQCKQSITIVQGDVELISRILGSENNGRRQITIMFDAMTQNFDVELKPPGASSHIHVSPERDIKLHPNQKKQAIKAAMYYNRVMIRAVALRAQAEHLLHPKHTVNTEMETFPQRGQTNILESRFR